MSLGLISTHPSRLNNTSIQPRPGALGRLPPWVMDSLVKEWTVFLDRCFENRIQAEFFDAAATQLHTKSPLPGPKLATLLLRPRAPATSSLDPRVVVYAERLLALKKVDTSDVLSALFQHSKDRLGTGQGDHAKDSSPWQNPPELEEIIFCRLQKAYSGPEPERPATNTEGYRTLVIVARWMSAMVISHTNDSMLQAINGTERQPHDQQRSINARDALGLLASALIDNGRILQLLNNAELKGRYLFLARYEMWVSGPAQILVCGNLYSLNRRRSEGLCESAVDIYAVLVSDFDRGCKPARTRSEHTRSSRAAHRQRQWRRQRIRQARGCAIATRDRR